MWKVFGIFETKRPTWSSFLCWKENGSLEIFRTVFWKLRIIGKIEGTVQNVFGIFGIKKLQVLFFIRKKKEGFEISRIVFWKFYIIEY